MSINLRDSDNFTPLLLCILRNSSDHEIPCIPCAAPNSDQKTRLELQRKKTPPPPPPPQRKKGSRTESDAIRYGDCENVFSYRTRFLE
jgi:hypothetical protein